MEESTRKKKWLAELIANERVVERLLINLTWKWGATEKKMGKRRRSDQEGEEQLGNPWPLDSSWNQKGKFI